MKFLSILTLLTFLLVLPSWAQNYVGGNAAQGSEINTLPFGAVQEVDLRDFNPKIDHHYLDENWIQGTIEVKGGQKITNYPLRYDLLNGLMEIKAADEIKVLPKARIDRFTLLGPNGAELTYFTNLKSAEGTPLLGVFRVVNEGAKWSLLNQTTITIVPPTYNKVLDAGDQEEKKLLKEEYLFYDGNTAIKTGSSRKKFVEQFPEEMQAPLLAFMKASKLSTKKELDLLQIVDFLNR